MKTLQHQPNAVVLPGTGGARLPFFSPNGQWVGLLADGKLKKIAFQGGAPVTLCDAPRVGGGTWGEDGRIIAALKSPGGLYRVSETGGTPEPMAAAHGQEEAVYWG